MEAKGVHNLLSVCGHFLEKNFQAIKQSKSSRKKGSFTSMAMESKSRHSRMNILKLAKNNVNVINSMRVLCLLVWFLFFTRVARILVL